MRVATRTGRNTGVILGPFGTACYLIAMLAVATVAIAAVMVLAIGMALYGIGAGLVGLVRGRR